MKFEILLSKSALIKSKIQDGYYFNLKANNGEIIATSEIYTSKQSCKKGIRAVKKCFLAKIVDLT